MIRGRLSGSLDTMIWYGGSPWPASEPTSSMPMPFNGAKNCVVFTQTYCLASSARPQVGSPPRYLSGNSISSRVGLYLSRLPSMYMFWPDTTVSCIPGGSIPRMRMLPSA